MGMYILYAIILSVVELILMSIAAYGINKPDPKQFPMFIFKYIIGNLIFLLVLERIPIN